MESKSLVEAGSGNIELLSTMSHPNPKDSSLCVSTKDGHVEFEHKTLLHNSVQVSETIRFDGYRPTNSALVMEDGEILRKFLEIARRLESKEERGDLGYAVSNGNIQVMNELLSACPESIKDVSASGDTLLHVAVKNNQIHGFGVLIKWIEMLNMRDIVNWSDCNGNTVLHIATSKKQAEIIEMLLNKGEKGVSTILGLNARNSKGLTAMDILEMLDYVTEDPKTIHIRQILHGAGAMRAQENFHQNSTKLLHIQSTKTQNISDQKEEMSRNWFKYFKFQRDRDPPNDTRNALLVVAALIATITFQAGVNLPTGILKLTENINNISSSTGSNAGDSVLRKTNLDTHVTTYLFLFTNSAGLTSSLSIIMYLTAGFPFQRELLMAMYCMVFSYGFSISSITNKPLVTYLLLGIALILPLSLRWLPIWGNKAWNWWKEIRHTNYKGNYLKQHTTSVC